VTCFIMIIQFLMSLYHESVSMFCR